MNDRDLRDYFAAHAPLPVPDWFKGESGKAMPTVPDAPSYWNAAQAAQFSDLKQGIGLVSHAAREVAEFYAIYLAAKARHAAWRDEQREKKYFAWRWHYADQMMANRNT